MEQIFDLEVSADRPILRLDDLFPGCTALIDTGALFPVWTKSRELLEALGAEIVSGRPVLRAYGYEAVERLQEERSGNILNA